ncbi:MAG: hypothetical protein ACNA7X_05240 [Dehalococcoidia bacterium]
MASTVFLKARNLARMFEFYTGTVTMSVWPEQPEITILRHENLFIGFQQPSTADVAGVLTFLCPNKRDVDAMYEVPRNLRRRR